MIILFIIGIILGGISVVFALQNITIITVNFLSWELTGSLALIILFAMASGVVVVMLFLLPELIANSFKYRRLRKENEKLAEELRKQKELTIFAKETPPTAEDISHIENEAIEKRNYNL